MTGLFTDDVRDNPLASSPCNLRDWTDPNPLPVVSLLPDGLTAVVRDDLLPGGTKVFAGARRRRRQRHQSHNRHHC